MKKIVSVMLVLILSLALVVGCAPSEPKTTEPGGETEAPKDGYTIALLVKDSTTPFWRYVVTGAEEVAAELNCTVIEYAPLQTQNLEEQVRQVEDAIQKGVDAIAIAPIDSEGIIPAIEKANAAGIPVITTNSKSSGGDLETFIGVDNYEAAKTLAEYMMKELDGKGNVVIIEGNPAGQTSQDRVAGFTEVIEQYPDVNLLVSQPGMFQRAEAMAIMENLIQANPDIDAVMALNDEMALGALQALQDAGITDVKVTGFDGAKEGLEAIVRGALFASMNQAPFDQGGVAVRAAVDVLNGKKIDDWIKVGGEVCDISNAAEMLKLFD